MGSWRLRVYAAYRHQHHHHKVSESSEEYQARLRRTREEQEAAEARRAEEEAARKATQERERQKGVSIRGMLCCVGTEYSPERREAEARQKAKASSKKAQAEASRKSAADKVRLRLERSQESRSTVFAAARRGEVEKVQKGIWESGVDASGGEVKKGAECFVKDPPKDPLETLLHIAARKGTVSLVEWLDTHSK